MKRLLIFLIFCVACSSLSHNMIQTGDLSFQGGRFNDKEWSDRLTFKRVSWFKELSLEVDALIYTVDKKSPFYNWFSSEEQRSISNCHQYLVALVYTALEGNIKKSDFKDQMKENGYSDQQIPSFTHNLKGHPEFSQKALMQYRVVGFCREIGTTSKLRFHLPNYAEAAINL